MVTAALRILFGFPLSRYASRWGCATGSALQRDVHWEVRLDENDKFLLFLQVGKDNGEVFPLFEDGSLYRSGEVADHLVMDPLKDIGRGQGHWCDLDL